MKKRAHPTQKKKLLDYPEETEGSRLAAKGRQMAKTQGVNSKGRSMRWIEDYRQRLN